MARPKKKPQPEQARLAVLYARVSTKEQQEEGYSIDAQLALLRAYAQRAGLQVAAEFVESDSAKAAGRAQFQRMLSFLRAGKAQAILVEKTDRLYRNISDWVRVDELRCEIHLVKENEILSDTSRSHQKFVHGIKVLVAKNYSDNLSEETQKGMLEKARQGIWPTVAPLGYRNVSTGARRVIAPDPERAPLIRQCFETFAKGRMSVKQLSDYAYSIGLRTVGGKRVPTSNLHVMLRHPVYCGVIRWKDEEHDGIHESLVDRSTWLRCQAVLSGRNVSKAKPAAERDFLYRGLLRCGRCGCQISAQTTKGHVYYACTGAKGCKRTGIREEEITEAIAGRLEGITIRPHVLDMLRAALRQSLEEQRIFREDQVSRLERERANLRLRLEQLYIDRLNGSVPDIVYPGLKSKWEMELASIDQTLAAMDGARQRHFDDNVALLEFASNAYSTFKSASRGRKREMAKNLLSNSTLTDGKLQLSFHLVFELILEANQKTEEPTPKEPVLTIWLPAKDSNLD